MPRKIQRARRRPIAALIGALCTGAALADGEHPERTDVIEVIGHYQNAIGTSDAASQGYITPKLIESRPIQRPADVLEAVVFGMPHPHWEEAVTAVVALRVASVVSEAELIDYCRRFLSGYKLPKQVFIVDALPRNGSNKIDKRALVARYAGQAAACA